MHLVSIKSSWDSHYVFHHGFHSVQLRFLRFSLDDLGFSTRDAYQTGEEGRWNWKRWTLGPPIPIGGGGGTGNAGRWEIYTHMYILKQSERGNLFSMFFLLKMNSNCSEAAQSRFSLIFNKFLIENERNLLRGSPEQILLDFQWNSNWN